MRRGAVLLEENGTARVCQKCLVKWARKRMRSVVVCNTCYRKLNSEHEERRTA